MTLKHDTKNCQCCGKGFECKSGEIQLCQCKTVALSQEQREYIGLRYSDCLCADCLVRVRDEFNKLQDKEKNQAI